MSPQQWLRTSAGTHVQISAIGHHTANTRVHNLTVADLHTYYVLAGSRPVLVHNSDPCKTAVLGVRAAGEQLAAELRSANPGRVVETYNDRSLRAIPRGESHPPWIGKVRDAVYDTRNYDLAISLDGLKRYGNTPSEIWQSKELDLTNFDSFD